MEIEKVFFRCVPPGTEKILLHTVVVLQYRHHIKMACLVLGVGRLSKCSKTIYNACPSNQLTSIILFGTVACLYTYFYLVEHDLVFEKGSHIRRKSDLCSSTRHTSGEPH